MSTFIVHHYVCPPIKFNFYASLLGNLPSVHYLLLPPFIACIDGDFELTWKVQDGRCHQAMENSWVMDQILLPSVKTFMIYDEDC